MPSAQAAKVRDSLRVLPIVRREAGALRKAASQYRAAADTAQAAYFWQSRSLASVQVALREEKGRTVQEHEQANNWKAKARRRGFLNWLTVVTVVVVTGLAVR
jgi:TPR repeat protein